MLRYGATAGSLIFLGARVAVVDDATETNLELSLSDSLFAYSLNSDMVSGTVDSASGSLLTRI